MGFHFLNVSCGLFTRWLREINSMNLAQCTIGLKVIWWEDMFGPDYALDFLGYSFIHNYICYWLQRIFTKQGYELTNRFYGGWSTRARTSLTCASKFRVQSMNRPDVSNPTRSVTFYLAPFFWATVSNPPRNRRPFTSMQLRHTCEQKLLSASQDDRVTPSRHRGCVNVWLGMWDPATEDTGSGPGAAVLRKVALGSRRAPLELKQTPLFTHPRFKLRGLRVNFW